MIRAVFAWVIWPISLVTAGFAAAFSAPRWVMWAIALASVAPAAAMMRRHWPGAPERRVHAYLAVVTAGAAACALGWLLESYLRFYHLHAPGTGLALVLLILPGAFLLSGAAGLAVARGMERRGARHVVSLAAGVATILLIVSAMLIGEVASTTRERSAEGDGAGKLGPFVHGLIR